MVLTSEHKARLKQALLILQNENRWHSARELVNRLGLRDPRELRRTVIAPLRFDYRIPIHSLPSGTNGYKLGVTAKEHVHCRELFKTMARNFFAIESVLRCESIDTVFAQMTMNLLPKDADSLFPSEEIGEKDALSILIDQAGRTGRKVSFVDVVDKLLSAMAQKPEKYAQDIERISKRHGGVFISAEQRTSLQAHARAIQDMLGQAGNPQNAQVVQP